MESFWDECLALPSKLKDWDAYHDLKGAIQKYLDVFPLLHQLAAKVTIHKQYRRSIVGDQLSSELIVITYKYNNM